MTNADRVRAHLAEVNPDAVLYAGFDDALLGIGERCGEAPIALYDRGRCLGILRERDGMDADAAEEFLAFNVEALYAGPHTPMLVTIAGTIDG